MTAAQQQLQAVFQSTMECVAAVCDELEPAFPDVAPHAAHFFQARLASRFNRRLYLECP